MASLRNRLLEVGFGPYVGHFASGAQANNKLDLSHDNLLQDPQLYGEVVQELADRIEPYEPDLIVPIPNGATGYGREVAFLLGIDHVPLLKNPVTGDITFRVGQIATAMESNRTVVIEDVMNQLTTTRRVLQFAGIATSAVAVVAVWDRGDPATRQPLPPDVALQAIVSEPIDAWLPKSSPLWKAAQRP